MIRLIIPLIALDQAIKHLVVSGLFSGMPGISVLYNDKSIVWAIFASSLITLFFIALLRDSKSSNSLYKTGIAIILAGGLSNMIDYAHLQAVIDTFNLTSFHFNLADAYIVIGGGLIVTSTFKVRRPGSGIDKKAE